MASKEKRLLKKPIAIKQKTRAVPDGYLTGNLDDDAQRLKQIVRDAGDLKCREIYTRGHRRVTLFYYAYMVDTMLLSQAIIRPIQEYPHEFDISRIAQSVLTVPTYTKERELTLLADALTEGMVVVLFEGSGEALTLGIKKVEHRGIERSESEDVLLGPHESFSENLNVNLALMRTKITSTDFKTKIVNVGKVSRTNIAILFVEGIVSEELVEEVEERLRRLDIDFISGAAHVAELICDEPTALLPVMRVTERPSRVIGSLMEGRVVIMGDGDPSGVIIPTFAPEYLQSSED